MVAVVFTLPPYPSSVSAVTVTVPVFCGVVLPVVVPEFWSVTISVGWPLGMLKVPPGVTGSVTTAVIGVAPPPTGISRLGTVIFGAV